MAHVSSEARPAAAGAAATPELVYARSRTMALIDGLRRSDLERVVSPLMSPLVWDLAHIAAYEDLWLVHRHGGHELLHSDLAATYDAFETPREVRGEVELLDLPGALSYLADVRERTCDVLAERGAGDGTLVELVAQHELQHQETMLQTLALARLDYWRAPDDFSAPAPDNDAAGGGLELIDVPAGRFAMGAPDGHFSYDNERPCHEVDVPAFRIGRRPVTNGTYLSFVEGGGYQRREWWRDEAWSWKQEYDITRPLHWADDGREWRMGRLVELDPDAPVAHVSWFEADAFARAHDARLPAEQEWEKAATWDQSPLLGVGHGWEWTATVFDGYPGFVAHPYREYSEVFFGRGHRVLRGGSWASDARVATPTFRNWDLPERRQIFSGLRIAREA